MRNHKPPPFDLAANDGGSLGNEEGRCNASPHVTKPKVHFDWRDWVHFWDEADCSEAELKEFIETYWLIILAFRDLDIEVGVLENANNTAINVDKSAPIIDLSAALKAAVLQSKVSNEKDEASKTTTSVEEESREEIL